MLHFIKWNTQHYYDMEKLEHCNNKWNYNLQKISQTSTVEDIAKDFYRSPSQFSRDLYAATGYSVHEYQRHLRLSKALCCIKTSQMSLAEISYICGYSSQQALCREIRSRLHMTATEYRESDSYYFFSSYDKAIPYLTEVSKVKIPKTVCLRFYHPVLWGLESRAVQAFLNANPTYSGRIFGRNGIQYKSKFCYELYVEEMRELNTDGFTLGTVRPAYNTTCAQVRVRNSEDEINAAWDWLYSVWLPKSMFAYAGMSDPVFEKEYFEEFFYKNTQVRRLRLYLPVQHRNNFLKITLEDQTIFFLASDSTGSSAETEASRTVLRFLARMCPGVLKNAVQFYYQQENNRCTCGVKIGKPIPHDERLRTIRYENTPFAILHFQGIHAFAEASELLLAWLRDNRFTPSDKPFAVYDTTENEEEPNMMLYCPLET